MAYHELIKREEGLHEQHLAEELHRYSELPTMYTDDKGKVRVNPSVPPMGDPLNFHGSNWTGKRFDKMWEYWMRYYPAHAYDIEREIQLSKEEERRAWWDLRYNIDRGYVEEPGKKRRCLHPPAANMATQPNKRCKYMKQYKSHFELTYLESPCRVCGSEKHSALRLFEDDYGMVIYKYACPVAVVEDWEGTCMRPCPIKMAKLCDYSEEEVDKTWNEMVTEGWGQHQTSKVIGLFLRIAHKCCREKGEQKEGEK